MTKLIVETDNDWTKKKITDAIHTEKELLRKVLKLYFVSLNNYWICQGPG